MFHKRTRNVFLALAVLIALAGTAARPTAEAQLRGGGLGGGFQGGFGIGGIMVEQSQSGKSLYAYSETAGAWDKLTVEPHPVDGLSFVQSVGVAALRGKHAVHAIGADAGKWSTAPTDGDPSPAVVSGGLAACVAGSHLYAFGSSSETWAVADLGEPADAMKLEAGANRVVYRSDTHVHIFSNASGKWASVDLTKD
jgi:hypothetical protein